MPTNNAINLSAAGVVTYSGTGSFTASTITANQVLIGNTSNTIQGISLTNGQLAIGSTSAEPVAATISAGSGIAVANGAGSITISSAGGGLAWSVITANQAIAVNNGYICNKAGLLTLTLPTTSAVGTVFAVTNINTAAGIEITYTTNQQIFMGSSSTTITTGNIECTALGDSLYLVCTSANLVWQVISSMGNWTLT